MLKRTQTKQGSCWAVDWLPVIFLDVFFYSWKQTTANFKSSKTASKLTIIIQINLEPSPTFHIFPFWCTFFIGHWPEQNSRSDKYSFIPRHSSVCWDGRQYLQSLNLLHFGGYLFISAGVVLWLSTPAAGFRKRFVTLSGFAAQWSTLAFFNLQQQLITWMSN